MDKMIIFVEKAISIQNCSAADAIEIVDGYGSHDVTARQKKAYWSEDDEKRLATVFQ
jgi:hypothetical protein